MNYQQCLVILFIYKKNAANFTDRAEELSNFHITRDMYHASQVQEMLLFTPFAGGCSRVQSQLLGRCSSLLR
jgi:hypothetical protein